MLQRTGTIWPGLGASRDPTLARLAAALPVGWSGRSDWVSVAGNAVLLTATLVLTRRRPASVGELSPGMRQRS